METATLLLLNSLTNICQTRPMNATSATAPLKLSILDHLWLPQNVASTTWEERLLVLTFPFVTSHVRHPRKFVRLFPMMLMLLLSSAGTPSIVLTTSSSPVLWMILLLVRVVLFLSTLPVDLPRLMIFLELFVTIHMRFLRKKPTTTALDGNTFHTVCT